MNTAEFTANIITHFFCGCIYFTPTDTAVFCPQHLHSDTPSFATGREAVRIPQGSDRSAITDHGQPSLGPLFKTLYNSTSNSVHIMSYVSDGGHNKWNVPDADQFGLCCACFIDQDILIETRVAMCECGEESCSYRWCGNTDGLHALWRLHANGISGQETGIPERDIFSYGPCREQPEKIQNVLDRERQDLESRIQAAVREFTQARTQAKPTASPKRSFQPVYLTPWLDPAYQAIIRQSNPKELTLARNSLRRRLARLLITGAV